MSKMNLTVIIGYKQLQDKASIEFFYSNSEGFRTIKIDNNELKDILNKYFDRPVSEDNILGLLYDICYMFTKPGKIFEVSKHTSRYFTGVLEYASIDNYVIDKDTITNYDENGKLKSTHIFDLLAGKTVEVTTSYVRGQDNDISFFEYEGVEQ